MVGTIFDLPDDMRLQRGMTFTILPDGRSLRVPSMNRLQVRADSQSHEEDGDHDAMQALTDMLRGKKPVNGRARHNIRGQAHGNRLSPGPATQEERNLFRTRPGLRQKIGHARPVQRHLRPHVRR